MFIISIILAILSILVVSAVLFKKYNRLPNITFSIGLLATSAAVFGDTITILKPEIVGDLKRAVFILEGIMVVALYIFSLSFARAKDWSSISNLSKIFIFLSPVIFLLLGTVRIEDIYYSPEFEIERVLFLGNIGFIFNILLLLYSIMSIVNLEVTLRSSSGADRWSIKYILMGVGGILSINIFYYSHALLFRSIDMNLLPVRAGVILVSVLLIGFSILRHKVMDIEVVVSRKILFRSLSIIIVGIYLLGIGIIGEGLRYFGPKIANYITTFLAFAGALAVLAIILSEQLRRKAIVFINKNFYNQKYDYRERWLQFTQQISLKHTLDELIGSIADGIKDAIGSRGASVWLRERDSGEFKCVKTIDSHTPQAVPDEGLIDFFKDKKWVLNINDNKCRDVVLSSAAFLAKTQAFLIVPLFNLDELIGFIVLMEGLADYEYNYEDYDLLKTLASQATAAILNARLSEELTEAKEMEVVGRLSSFIIHDLKNAASKLSLIVQNAEEHIDNPEFQKDAIKAVANSSEKIKRIIEKLKNLPKKTLLDIKRNNLGDCVKAVILEISSNGKSKINFNEVEPVKTKFDREEIGKVVINLIINALDATDSAGNINVLVGKENNMGFVKVSDNGCGMSGEFIDKYLFKPFHTTKKKGLGIGLYQSKVIIEAHEGKIKINSQEGMGTDFIVYLPLNV